MSAAAKTILIRPRAVGKSTNPHPLTPPTLLDAAKVVVALSGWQTVRRPAPPNSVLSHDTTDRVFVTSALAIEVLKAAIRREENPTFTLAPEPVRPGVL